MLYIVATPIGHLQDISQRALDVLAAVDLIAAEDTRLSRRLLQAYDIGTPLAAYHDFSSEREIERLLAMLRQGKTLALISDAGTPLISDPGYRLVRSARLEGIAVVPVPGPSALTAALCASGLPCDRFVFEGFLPVKSAQRRTFLEQLAKEPRTMVFYEAPRRLRESLEDMQAVFSAQREAVLARELTKRFETIRLMPLGELLQWVREDELQLKGECVLLVAGLPKKQAAADDLDQESERIARLLAAELPPKKAAAITAQITGANKRDIYSLLTRQ